MHCIMVASGRLCKSEHKKAKISWQTPPGRILPMTYMSDRLSNGFHRYEFVIRFKILSLGWQNIFKTKRILA